MKASYNLTKNIALHLKPVINTAHNSPHSTVCVVSNSCGSAVNVREQLLEGKMGEDETLCVLTGGTRAGDAGRVTAG